jgi:hypothetical protein
MLRHAGAPKPRLDHAPWNAPLHWGKLASGPAPAPARHLLDRPGLKADEDHGGVPSR